MIKHPKFPRGNIYLSGGMEHADDLGSGWRKEARTILQDLGYFPLDITQLDKEYQKEHGDLYRVVYDNDGNLPEEEAMLQRKANIRKHFIYTDLELIKNDTDALLVYYDESARLGAGTISECQVAYLYDIPIFIVSGYENWQTEVPGWLFALSTKMFSSFDDVYNYMSELPNGILTRDVYGNRSSGTHYLCSLSGKPFKKEKTHFVSRVSPLYSTESVDLIKTTNEKLKDRYQFFVEFLEEMAQGEVRKLYDKSR